MLLSLLACTDNQVAKEPELPIPLARISPFSADGNAVVAGIDQSPLPELLLPNGNPVVTGKSVTLLPEITKVAAPRALSVSPPSRIQAYPNRKTISEYNHVTEATWKISKSENLQEEFIQGLSAELKLRFQLSGTEQPLNWTQKHAKLPRPVPSNAPISREQASYDIRSLDVEQGMASSYVLAIAEDSYGALWMGTGGGGLSRYNGNSFIHFTEEYGLSKNYILCLQFDQAGNLWFGTNGGGLGKFDGKYFYYLNTDNGLLSNTVLSLHLDETGSMWCGLESGGIARISQESITHYTALNGFSAQSVWAISSDVNGTVYAGTEMGLFRFNGSEFSQLEYGKTSSILCLSRISKSEIWAGTGGNGILILRGNTLHTLSKKEGLHSDYIVSLYSADEETIYIGSDEDGLAVLKSGQVAVYKEKEGLTSPYVSCSVQDSKRRIWLGTYRGGVNLFNPNSFKHYTQEEGFSKSVVQAIAQDDNNSIWLGTDGEGLFRYTGKEFLQYHESKGFPSNYVHTALKDSKGYIWFGTEWGGLIRYKNGNFEQLGPAQGLSAEVIISLAEANDGTLWIGTDGDGLIRYTGTEFHRFSTEQGFPHDIIPALQTDKDGNLWIGTNGSGLVKFDGNSFLCISPNEGLPNAFISTLKIDANNLLWIGTEGGGLWAFDGNQFMGFTEYEGLTHNTIWSITEDSENRLWVATEKGLTVLMRDVERPAPYVSRLLTLTSQSGLKGLDFYPNAALLDRENQLWWGTGKALSSIDLNTIELTNIPQAVSLSQIEINEKYFDFNNEASEIAGIKFKEALPFSNIPQKLTLSHHLNHLSFHFSPTQWIAPERLWYSYYLEGIDKAWGTPTRRSLAEYRNIPAGKYTLWVRALNDGNTWGEPNSFSFEILPPWWLTWWAKLAYFVLLVLAIIQIFRWRTAALLKRQQELERLVSERTRELSEEKREVEKQRDEVEKQRKVSDELLLNILPAEIAQELKSKGSSDAKLISEATVLFTDFKGFTEMSETLSPKELVSDINECFSAFDNIIERHGVEKIKTIGDAYMAAGGLPSPNTTHARDVLNAALEIQRFMQNLKKERMQTGKHYFDIRIGIHTGPVVAGIVGIRKFQYDIWGDTVNTASRMESNSEIGKINVSETTYNLVKQDYQFMHRGKIEVKGKGEMNMFFLEGTI